MSEMRYDVTIDGEVIAKNLTLEIAMLLANAAFDKYWEQAAECGMAIQIYAHKMEVSGDG